MVQAINLALYIPMILVFGLCCTFFLISGYKKGMWRSLLSLGASLAAVIVSLLLSKLLGWLLAGPVAGALAGTLLSEAEVPPEVMTLVGQSVIQAVLTFIFFGIFFIVAVILAKIFFKKIHFKKMDDEPQDQKGWRFAGMGLRGLDAVIVSLVVMLPLYGPLSVAVPTVAGIVNMSSAEATDVGTYSRALGAPVDLGSHSESSAVQLVKTLDAHPMISVYKGGPASLVVRSLSTVSFGGETIDAVEIMRTLEGLFDRFTAFEAADGQEQVDALEELVRYTRGNVIEKGWSYGMVRALYHEFGKTPELADEDLQKVYALADMDFETYKSNGIALLDFIGYALQNDFMAFKDSGDFADLSDEFYEKLGELINHSQQAIGLKKLMFMSFTESMFDEWKSAFAFIDQHISDQPLAKELQKQEAETFMFLFFNSGSLDSAEALVRHPNIAYADVKPYLDQMVQDYYEEKPYLDKVTKVLHQRLAACEKAPLQQYTLSQYADDVVALAGIIHQDEYAYDFSATDAELQQLVNSLPDDFFKGAKLNAQKVKKLLKQAVEEARQNPGVRGRVEIEPAYNGDSKQVFYTYTEYGNFSDGYILGEDGYVAVRPGAGTEGGYIYYQGSLDGGTVQWAPSGDGSYATINPNGHLTIIR